MIVLDFIVSFFVMLYLLFFTLRDGAAIARGIRPAVPLRRDILQKLLENFVNVVRATVKGNLVVAAVQGVSLPDYVVLISTFGGLALFGLNGFVIGPVIAALFIAAWRIMSVEADAEAR